MMQLIQRVIDMKLMIQWAITSSALILIVLAARYLFRNKLSARLRYALWGVVLLRLLVPFQVELPAPVSDALPVLASNLAPEVGQWEEPSIPVFPERSKPVAEFNLDIETTLEPGDILSYSDVVGCLRREGETITWYRYILSPEQIVLALWLVGTGLAGAVMLVANLRFYGRLRKRRKTLEGTEAPIPVYTAAHLSSPCLFGVFKPAVYVTPGAAEDETALRHILAHELTHYAHRDHIWSLLRCLALALHWYNPLVWLAVILSKRDGELACDEGSVARLGEGERVPYGRTLVDMVAQRSPRPGDLLSCSTAMTGGEKSVKARVLALVKKPETVKAALFAVIAVVALAAVFVFAGRGQPDNIPHNFLGYVERADSIQYSPPLYSSVAYPCPITDEDLLAEAKKGLSGVTYLRYDDPQPDLSPTALIHESRIVLTFEGREMEYSLLWQNDRTYLFLGSIFRQYLDLKEEEGETVQLVEVSGTLVSKPGVNLITILAGLASGSWTQQLLLQDPSIPVPLTQEELGEYTPLGIQRDHGYQLQGWSGDLARASFYHGTRVRSDGTVQLWYHGDEEHGGVWVLEIWPTPLSSHSSGYNIVADQPMEVYNAGKNAGEEAPYEQLGAGAFAAALRPEDVVSVTAGDYEPGQAVEVDLPALKEQMVHGLYHQLASEYDPEKHGRYVITVHVEKDVGYYLQDGGRDGLILSAGSEPDVVCLRHRILSIPNREVCQFVRSPELYRAIRNIFD